MPTNDTRFDKWWNIGSSIIPGGVEWSFRNSKHSGGWLDLDTLDLRASGRPMNRSAFHVTYVMHSSLNRLSVCLWSTHVVHISKHNKKIRSPRTHKQWPSEFALMNVRSTNFKNAWAEAACALSRTCRFQWDAVHSEERWLSLYNTGFHGKMWVAVPLSYTHKNKRKSWLRKEDGWRSFTAWGKKQLWCFSPYFSVFASLLSVTGWWMLGLCGICQICSTNTTHVDCHAHVWWRNISSDGEGNCIQTYNTLKVWGAFFCHHPGWWEKGSDVGPSPTCLTGGRAERPDGRTKPEVSFNEQS